jgi:hypothetical protein
MFKELYTPGGQVVRYENGDELYIKTNHKEIIFPYTVCGVFNNEEIELEFFETFEDAQQFIEDLENEVSQLENFSGGIYLE